MVQRTTRRDDVKPTILAVRRLPSYGLRAVMMPRAAAPDT